MEKEKDYSRLKMNAKTLSKIVLVMKSLQQQLVLTRRENWGFLTIFQLGHIEYKMKVLDLVNLRKEGMKKDRFMRKMRIFKTMKTSP